MNGGAPPRQPPSAVRDADRSRPATWRWVAFFTLVLMVLSLWVPLAPSRDAGAATNPTPFTLLNGLLLVGLVALAVWVVPAPGRVRLWIAGILLATTIAAWLLADPIRDLLGGSPPPDVPLSAR